MDAVDAVGAIRWRDGCCLQVPGDGKTAEWRRVMVIGLRMGLAARLGAQVTSVGVAAANDPKQRRIDVVYDKVDGVVEDGVVYDKVNEMDDPMLKIVVMSRFQCNSPMRS